MFGGITDTSASRFSKLPIVSGAFRWIEPLHNQIVPNVSELLEARAGQSSHILGSARVYRGTNWKGGGGGQELAAICPRALSRQGKMEGDQCNNPTASWAKSCNNQTGFYQDQDALNYLEKWCDFTDNNCQKKGWGAERRAPVMENWSILLKAQRHQDCCWVLSLQLPYKWRFCGETVSSWLIRGASQEFEYSW